MRRMYSEQELTNVIKKVFEEELESGALDDLVSDAVDAYLVEHPVDVTALEGQDVELNSLDATGLITGGEIVEKMSGYSFELYGSAVTPAYAGAVKNGNKITFVVAGTLQTGASHPDGSSYGIGVFKFPSAIGDQLYPIAGSRLADTITPFISSLYSAPANAVTICSKLASTTIAIEVLSNQLATETEYEFRYEITFLLSDNLVPEE